MFATHRRRVLLVALASCLVAWGCSRAPELRPGGIEGTPLRAAAGGGTPRFVRLAPAECGLVFTNELKKENTYQYLTNGAGLAVGDYDGDGLPDVYLVSQDGPNKLFRQVSPLHFEDVTTKAGGVDGGRAWGTGATFVDVDGDGDLDLYVCNLEAKNLLYENQGDGTFRENAAKYGLDVVAASMMAAFADYDRDGKLDCYLLTNRALHVGMTPGWTTMSGVTASLQPPSDTARPPTAMLPTFEQVQHLGELQRAGKLSSDDDLPAELREHFLVFRGQTFPAGQPDRLLRNVGGRFVDVSTSARMSGFGMGLSATWWDYDDDGFPDLYVANDLESPDTLWHNEGDGTFRDVTKDVLPHTAYYGMGSDAGDVDGDGRLDFLVADMSMTTHKKAKVLMGDMTRQREFLIRSRPPQYMRNALFLNTGRSRFEEAGILAGVASTDWTWSVLFGDLDNDARLDLFVTNGIARFDTDPDLEIRLLELLRQKRDREADELIQNVRKVPEKNLALKNRGDLQFTKTGADWGLDLEAVSHGAALVDFDGDGDLDVVVNNWNEPAAIYENRTTDGNAITVALRGQLGDRFGIGARLTARLGAGRVLVREMWPCRGYLSGQDLRVHFGLGAATSIAELEVRWPSGRTQTFADLAVGQHYVVTEPPGERTRSRLRATSVRVLDPVDAPPFEHRENELDEYVDQPLLPAGVSRLGPGVAFGDFDGDGADDLFVGGAAGQAGALFRSTAGGWQRHAGPWEKDAACEDMGALWIDFDSDGDLDLFVASGGAERKQGDPLLRDRIYRNDGDGKFVRDDRALPDVRESSGHVSAADFDRDGDLDLFVAGRIVPGAYPDASPSRLYRNEGGSFVDVTRELAPALLTAGMVTSALFTDVDDDGFVDLLVAAHWQPIRFLRNDKGRTFVDRTEAAGLAPYTGWWNSLCAWDADGDGDLDYVAGNQGLNTKYKANPDHPARLFFGDLDDNGTRDLVEAKYEGDNLLPVRGRSCSSQAMPILAQKFPTYDAFASSLLKDIYSETKLAACGKLEATTLASCLLRNDGKGNLTVEPLPRAAQIAPIFGMVAADNLLVCAQNSYAPEPETGRHDGGTGLVLCGTAAGIGVVPHHEHGFCTFGDGKAAALRLAEDVEVMVANNDGPLRAYRIRPNSTKQAAPFVVRLAQPTLGNPQGIGTRAVIDLGTGERRAVEAQAGSGYLAQMPTCFFTTRTYTAQRPAVQKPPSATVRAPDGSVRTIPLPE